MAHVSIFLPTAALVAYGVQFGILFLDMWDS